MPPVIPKVRPGDLLGGTRNLRNYIQTARSLFILERILEGRRTIKDISPLSKRATFVVVANTAQTFAVWAADSILLLFRNRAGDTRISPQLFPIWFIRTPLRYPDMRKWPTSAYRLWAAWQMNGDNVGDSPLRINFPPMPRHQELFLLHDTLECNRDHIDEWVKRTLKRHMLHPSMPSAPRSSAARGPLLTDLRDMQDQLQHMRNRPDTKELFNKYLKDLKARGVDLDFDHDLLLKIKGTLPQF